MKKGWKRTILGCLLGTTVMLAVAGCGQQEKKGQEEKKILIAAAASLETVFEETLIPAFEEQNPGITVEGTYASSGDLQQQIEAGLEADLFFSAASANMDQLVEEGLIDKNTVVDLLKNDVVLIVPEGKESAVTGFEDMDKAETVAIGDPESVPAGQYAREILQKLQVYDKVLAKASLGNNVTEVLTWVAEGSADAGIVYATDAQKENNNGDDKKVRVLAVAEDSLMTTPVVYPVGITTASTKKEAAQKLKEYLQSEEVEAIFEKAGFSVEA